MKNADKKLIYKTFTSNGYWKCPSGITILNYYLINNNINPIIYKFNSISVGSFALKSDGIVWSWGINNGGRLGDNTTNNRSSPVLVIGNHSFIQISGGVALKQDGSVWAWNWNYGDNTTNNRSSPVLVIGNHSFIDISSNSSNSLARKKDGTVWVWGSITTYGGLGDNTTDNRSSPVLIVGNHSFIKISNRGSFFAALKQNGSIWTWGDNSYIELGDNTNISRSSPVSVVGNHSFINLSSGDTHVLALKQDGTVWAWGYGENGALGDNTGNDRSSPVLVAGNHSFITISGGSTHSLALKQDGSGWAWGNNSYGQLGNNNAPSTQFSPVLIIGNHSFTQINAGTGYSLAIKQDGILWSWGFNQYGQLGDNTRINKSSPSMTGSFFPITTTHNFTNNISVIPNTIYSIGFYGSLPTIKFNNKVLGFGETLVISWME